MTVILKLYEPAAELGMTTEILPVVGSAWFVTAENPGIALELPASMEYLSSPAEGLENGMVKLVAAVVTSAIVPIDMEGFATVTTKFALAPGLVSHPAALTCAT